MEAHKAGNRATHTREVLVQAALEVFGRDGFHAASTRAISETAGVNQALIAYHFGGKQCLYRATIQSITGNIAEHMGPLLDHMGEEIAGLDAATPTGRDACLALLDRIIAGAIDLFGQPRADLWVKLVMREQQDPTDAFDIFFLGVYSNMLARLTELVGKLSGLPAESEAARVKALTLMGQVLVFVVGRGTVARHVGWTRLGERERQVLHQTVRQSLEAMFREGGRA